jgi:hypothetical protein
MKESVSRCKVQSQQCCTVSEDNHEGPNLEFPGLQVPDKAAVREGTKFLL